MYIQETTGEVKDLSDISVLFDVLQKNTHIVAQYFDIRTRNYFHDVMSPAFGVTSFWYQQEFAKSRGMVHWHSLCWRDDKEPHALLSKAFQMRIVLSIYLIELPLNSVLLLLIQLVRMKMEILEKTVGLLLKALPHYHPKRNIPI